MSLRFTATAGFCTAGMIPLARELIKNGTFVVLAANEVPALNDITAEELKVCSMWGVPFIVLSPGDVAGFYKGSKTIVNIPTHPHCDW